LPKPSSSARFPRCDGKTISPSVNVANSREATRTRRLSDSSSGGDTSPSKAIFASRLKSNASWAIRRKWLASSMLRLSSCVGGDERQRKYVRKHARVAWGTYSEREGVDEISALDTRPPLLGADAPQQVHQAEHLLRYGSVGTDKTHDQQTRSALEVKRTSQTPLVRIEVLTSGSFGGTVA